MASQKWPSLYSFSNTYFSVDDGDFSYLEIRDSGKGNGFYYFFDTHANHLVSDFVLEERPQVATLCHVTLIKKDGKYSPRIKLWKRDKTKVGRAQASTEVENNPKMHVIKAYVDTGECYKNFWKVIGFLQSLADIEIPIDKFKMVASDQAELVELLDSKDKSTVLSAVKASLDGKITDADLQMLAGRKAQLEYFEQLLDDRQFFDKQKEVLDKRGDEAVWQHFFEQNAWIFGYGLSLISCESFDDQKLEQVTTGADIFKGAGKRSDAVMKTRGYVSSLLFCEIKTPDTHLLKPRQYRVPDVYQVSDELSGGVSQVQKTANKATRNLNSFIDHTYADDGIPLRVELSTIRPKEVLVIGNQQQLKESEGINLEKSLSFELYRKSINDVEIITFDELLERARFIVKDYSDIDSK